MDYQKLSNNQKQKLADDAKLLSAWRAWHREQLDQALAGVHGAVVSDLMRLLGRLDTSSGNALLDFVRSTDWISVDYSTRLTALHEINSAITRLRERNGMNPFDDNVPGERENLFRVARALLLASPAHAGD